MANLTSVKEIKAICGRFGFRFRKSLGQNFLVDEGKLHKIVKAVAVAQDDVVVEIGPGFGTLTVALAQGAGQVLSIEIDSSLLPVLEVTLADFPNVHVIHADALKVNIDNLVADKSDGKFGPGGRPYQIAANLPYYITTPIIMGILEAGYCFERMVVMVQKEVATRMMATPGTKDYGALSVAVQYYTIPEMVTPVPAGSFYPPPEVESAVVKLNRRSEPAVQVRDPKKFFAVVRAAFGQRRKTLLNALSSGNLGMGKGELEQLLQKVEIDPNRRGETLSLQEFAVITEELIGIKE